MATQARSVTRRVVTAVGIAGGAAAIATGMALAGAGTAAADNQQNVVTQTGNKFTPKSAATTSARSSVLAAPAVQSSDPGTDFLVNLGTALQNGEVQLGGAGNNALAQLGGAGNNALAQVGGAGNNALTQVGGAGNNALAQVGGAGNNALTQVGNAGYGVLGPLESLGDEQIRLQFETNLFGLVHVTQAVLPHMRLARSGTIINISSVGGRISFPLFSIYHNNSQTCPTRLRPLPL